MNYYGFKPTVVNAPTINPISKPIWKLTVNARDLTNIFYDKFKNWTPTNALDNIDYDSVAKHTFVGLSTSNANSTSTVSRTISLPKSGYYLILVRMRKHPQDTGYIKLMVDDIYLASSVERPNEVNQYANHDHEHTQTIIYPIHYFKSGSHDFEVVITREAYIHDIWVYPITKYIATNSNSARDPLSKKLNLIEDLTFTEYGLEAENTLDCKIELDSKLYNINNTSRIFCEHKDPVTLEIGHDYKNFIPKFSGYVYKRQLEEDVLNLTARDSLLDAVIQPFPKNFSIGKPPEKDYLEFGSVFAASRYLISQLEYPLRIENSNLDYGLNLDFSNVAAYNGVTADAYIGKSYDTWGNPGPSLLLKPLSVGFSNVTLWTDSSNPINAAEYPILTIPYNYRGQQNYTRNILPVDIGVTIHKEGQSVADAHVYVISFASNVARPYPLGAVTPIISSGWPAIKFDIKKAMDPWGTSDEYNVTRIKLVGDIASGHLNGITGLWVNGVQMYKEISSAPKFSISDGDNIYNALQKLCEETNHMMFIKPGYDRCDDIIVIQPQDVVTSIGTANEAINVRGVEDDDYDPLTNELCNCRYGRWTKTEGDSSNEEVYHVYAEDIDSIGKFGRVKTEATLDGIENEDDAKANVNKYISENKIKKEGITLVLDGSSLFSYSDYVLTEINNRQLNEQYQIRGIDQTIGTEDNNMETKLHINHFPSWKLRKHKGNLRYLQNTRNILY